MIAWVLTGKLFFLPIANKKGGSRNEVEKCGSCVRVEKCCGAMRNCSSSLEPSGRDDRVRDELDPSADRLGAQSTSLAFSLTPNLDEGGHLLFDSESTSMNELQDNGAPQVQDNAK